MTNLSKTDARTITLILAHARNGNHVGAQQLARSFVASAPSDKVAAKRRAAVAEHITEILETVRIGGAA
jgi:hypothetical protein